MVVRSVKGLGRDGPRYIEAQQKVVPSSTFCCAQCQNILVLEGGRLVTDFSYMGAWLKEQKHKKNITREDLIEQLSKRIEDMDDEDLTEFACTLFDEVVEYDEDKGTFQREA